MKYLNIIFIIIFLTLISVGCDLFDSGSSRRTYTDSLTNNRGTSCTVQSDCTGYCDLKTDICKDKEIGGVIISFATKIADAAVACQTGEAYMATGIAHPVCTCSLASHIDCEDGTGNCMSSGMCDNRADTHGGY